MSYYCNFSGQLRLKKEVNVLELYGLLCKLDKKHELFIGKYDIIENKNGNNYLQFNYDNNYYENGLYYSLKKIEPYIEDDQSFVCKGEDGTHWRFIKFNGEFYEQQGIITYDVGHKIRTITNLDEDE